MNNTDYHAAWYDRDRATFLAEDEEYVVGQLSTRANKAELETRSDQIDEWRASVSMLRGETGMEEAGRRIRAVRGAVIEVPEVHHVILEYDFRRRGLRMDAILLAPGVVFVVEFKRTRLTAADRDQVMSYAVNLLEFHRVTRTWAERGARVVPILVLTGENASPPRVPDELPPFAPPPWTGLVSRPIDCAGSAGLRDALRLGLRGAESTGECDRVTWVASSFAPSSTMIDAALSLYGQHDVSAIEAHAAPKLAIDRASEEIASVIRASLENEEHRLVLLSGAPGAGKTLVGLNLTFRGPDAAHTVFVTGNAPLVHVLQTALKTSYAAKAGGGLLATGYRHTRDAMGKVVGPLLRGAATYKIVTAHAFLGARGGAHGQEDGRIVVFDEAQRTYERGREVLRHRLEDHEADLILMAQRRQFPRGSVVVALIGHNQAINRGERGMGAWLEAARRLGWKVSAAPETLRLLAPEAILGSEIDHLDGGHLDQSMRFYRNNAMERWAAAVVENDPAAAKEQATSLASDGLPIRLTRSLDRGKELVRRSGERFGIIASGQARRLGAHGLFVDLKPDIAAWMLNPSSDFRSSNALETVQNQYQVQGMELDHALVAWDLDLRRGKTEWAAYRLAGASWNIDRALDIAKNSYRVLLTRARKGLVLFVPPGDPSGDDDSRPCSAYDAIAAFLVECGAELEPNT